jgi:hypothetical protein
MPTIADLAAQGASLLAKVRKDPGDADARAALDAIASQIEGSWTCHDVHIETWTREDIRKASLHDFESLVKRTIGGVAVDNGRWAYKLIAKTLG